MLKKQTFLLSDYLTEEFARACRTGEAVIICDTGNDLRTDAEAYARLKVGAYVVVPFHRDGRWVAHLVLLSETPRDWKEDEIELGKNIADRVFPRIERAKAEEALQKSEEKFRTVFESIDEGFCIQELIVDEEDQVVDLIYRDVNDAFARHTGLTNATGRKASELMPNLEQNWLDAMTHVYRTGEPLHTEGYQAHLDRWFTIECTRVGGTGSPWVAGVFNDITERKRHELLQAYLLRLSDALRPLSDALEIQSAAMRVLGEELQVDRVLYAEIEDDGETYHIKSNYVRGAYPELLGRFPTSAFGAASKGLRVGQVFTIENMTTEERLSEKERAAFMAHDVYASIGVPLIKAGRWVANLGIQHGQARQWTEEDIALVKETAERTWAAVERARAEEALRKREAQLNAIFKALPVGIGFIDQQGKMLLSNEEMRRYLPNNIMPSQDNSYTHWLAWNADGTPLERSQFPGARALQGEYVVPGIEMLYTPAEGHKVWTRVAAVPMKEQDGNTTGAVAVITDITQLKQAAEALREREERLQKVLSIETVGVIYFDLKGCIHEANLAFERMSGYSRKDLVQGRVRWTELTPPEFMEATLRAKDEYATKGQNTPYEKQYIRPDGTRWWGVFAGKRLSENEYVEFVLDITERKNAEKALRETRESLSIAVSAARMGTWSIDLTTDSSEHRNFRHDQIFGYEERQEKWGQEIARRHILDEDKAVFDAAFARAFETGELDFEVRVAWPDQSLHWIACRGRFYSDSNGKPVRGAGVNYDITQSKLAEQQLQKMNETLEQLVAERTQELHESKELLQTVFDTTLIGMSILKSVRDEQGNITDFRIELANKELERETDRTDLVGKLYAAEYPGIKETGLYDMMLRVVETGQPAGTEYFYPFEGFNKWYSCMFVKLQDGLVATNLDITERKKAEEENLNLRLKQQKELLIAILGAQEEERSRISESLHNGVAQILYATKLNLDEFSREMPRENLQKLNKLLLEAISETRRVSHELVPLVLRDFGLKRAIADMCGNLKNSRLQLECEIESFDTELDVHYELLLYRISQELINNILKHAGATKAKLLLYEEEDLIYLKVRDNGVGMKERKKTNKGIGLRSIEDKVKLLNGTFEISVPPYGKGTQVVIAIPL